jgi:hypothetical protein
MPVVILIKMSGLNQRTVVLKLKNGMPEYATADSFIIHIIGNIEKKIIT